MISLRQYLLVRAVYNARGSCTLADVCLTRLITLSYAASNAISFREAKRRFVMSIFGKLRDTKKAADKHKPAEPLAKPAPYKHIPTHAAIDSLACAPPCWRHMDDKKAIQAHYKRRSELSRSTNGLSVVTTLHRGDGHKANEWTITTMDQRSQPLPMPAMPGSEAMRRLSPLQASGNDEGTYTHDLY
jgi:hypothetical protein